jgi:hypothetical protein
MATRATLCRPLNVAGVCHLSRVVSTAALCVWLPGRDGTPSPATRVRRFASRDPRNFRENGTELRHTEGQELPSVKMVAQLRRQRRSVPASVAHTDACWLLAFVERGPTPTRVLLRRSLASATAADNCDEGSHGETLADRIGGRVVSRRVARFAERRCQPFSVTV